MTYQLPALSMPLPARLVHAIASRPTAQLVELATAANLRTDDASGDVLIGILKELEARMTEGDFVAFCRELEDV